MRVLETAVDLLANLLLVLGLVTLVIFPPLGLLILFVAVVLDNVSLGLRPLHGLRKGD